MPVQYIPKTNIVNGNTIQPSDITNIIDSLNQTGSYSVIATGSFSGSFSGDGSGLTGVVANNAFALTNGEGISTFSYNGSSAQTVVVSGAVDLTNNVITKWDDTAGKFAPSSLTDNGTSITGTTSIQLTGAASSLSGSFSGSFSGIVSSGIVSSSFRGEVVELSITSGTASLDCNLGNFFTLTASGSSIHISASNIQPGQTINFKLVNGSPTSSISFSAGKFYYPSGSAYTASTGTDILTFISFDSARLYSTNLNNFQSY